MSIKELLKSIENNSNFIVKEPCGLPQIENNHTIPKDVKEFYFLCGGIECYIKEGGFPLSILSPDNIISTNVLLFKTNYPNDISFSWYTIADAYDGNYISIDFDIKRLGRCYESFEYSHASKGYCPIIALSFTELLINIITYTGDYFYWKDNIKFKSHGDGYD